MEPGGAEAGELTPWGEEWLWHSLAESLGATVAELRDRLSPAEFCRWAAYYRVSPPLKTVLADALALVAQSNASLWAKKPPSFDAFRVSYGPPPPVKTEDELLAAAAPGIAANLAAWNLAMT